MNTTSLQVSWERILTQPELVDINILLVLAVLATILKLDLECIGEKQNNRRDFII